MQIKSVHFTFLLFVVNLCKLIQCENAYEEDYDTDETFYNKCRGEKENLTDYLGSYTPYRYRMNPDEKQVKIKGCKAVKIFILARHGSKYPSTHTIRKFRKYFDPFAGILLENMGHGIHEVGSKNTVTVNKGVLPSPYFLNTKFWWKFHIKILHVIGTNCRKEIFEMIHFDWNVNVPLGHDSRLSHLGEEEVMHLGHRLKIRFPHLFEERVEKYEIRHTATMRGNVSVQCFLIGLFDAQLAASIKVPPQIPGDPYLQFDTSCLRWMFDIKYNASVYKPVRKFARSEHMEEVTKQIASRLGLRIRLNTIHSYITPNWLQMLYQMCRWDTGISINLLKSPLCNGFSEKSAQVFINNDTNVFLFFLKNGAMVKMFTYLDLFKDEILPTADNFESMKKRKWKMSQINPQVSNLIFVLYNCTNKRKIQLLHNERPMHILGCPHNADPNKLCPFDVFLKVYHSKLYDCNYLKMCDVPVKKDTLPMLDETHNDLFYEHQTELKK